MKNWFILLAAGTILASCDAQSVKISVDLSKMTYQQDTRTGECFAVLGHSEGANITGNSQGFTITWVPCSPGVLKALE